MWHTGIKGWEMMIIYPPPPDNQVQNRLVHIDTYYMIDKHSHSLRGVLS